MCHDMCKCFGRAGERLWGTGAGTMLDRGWWCGYLCRSREGSDRSHLRNGRQAADFNPRSREGSDLPLERRLSLLQDFNPRSREGSDDKKSAVCGKSEVAMIFYRLLFQSTLPRRERRDNLSPNGEMINISIHAPAKGATHIWLFNTPTIPFQSTLPRRERRGLSVLSANFPYISIHAPAKGATLL